MRSRHLNWRRCRKISVFLKLKISFIFSTILTLGTSFTNSETSITIHRGLNTVQGHPSIPFLHKSMPQRLSSGCAACHCSACAEGKGSSCSLLPLGPAAGLAPEAVELDEGKKLLVTEESLCNSATRSRGKSPKETLTMTAVGEARQGEAQGFQRFHRFRGSGALFSAYVRQILGLLH